MARRGPDDRGSWDDGAACALGFRRLSIIDLSAGGHQPMVTEDGEHVVVFNGELYNYRELRDRARRPRAARSGPSPTPRSCCSRSPSGATDALARFNGMFAIGWYRPRSRTLVLARDPIGIKPLALVVVARGVRVRLAVRPGGAPPPVPPGRVDPAALHLYLRLGYLPLQYGLIEDTGQVPPGHFVELRPGGPARRRAGSGPRSPRRRRRERLRGAEADDAVAAMVDRGGPHASRSATSGWAPSSRAGSTRRSSLPTWSRRDGDAVPAFTIGTDDVASDESAPATEYAEMLGLEHHLRRISGADAHRAARRRRRRRTPSPSATTRRSRRCWCRRWPRSTSRPCSRATAATSCSGATRGSRRCAAARRWFRLPRAARVGAYGATKPLPVHRRPPRGVMFPTIGDWYLDAHSGLRQTDFDRIAPEPARRCRPT